MNDSIQNLNKNIWDFNDLKKVLKTNNYEKKTYSFNLCINDSNEFISSFYWKDEYYISGIDILKIIKFQLSLLNYRIIKTKKFEGYVFSILRNIKIFNCETSNSELLGLMYIGNCIRTQKKQKIFYWNDFPHDQILYEFLEKGMSTVEKFDNVVVRKKTFDESNILFILDKNISIFPKPLTLGDLDLSADFHIQFILPLFEPCQPETIIPQFTSKTPTIRNFKCGICKKSFKRKEHLIRHKDTHLQLKRHQCGSCSKNFSRLDNLKYHIKLVH